MKENEEKLLEQIVLTHVMRLNLLVNGIAVGLLFGLGLFLTTIFLVLKGGPVVGPHLGLLGQFLPGYAVTVAGSFVGTRIAHRFSQETLKRSFGFFLVFVASYMLLKSVL